MIGGGTVDQGSANGRHRPTGGHRRGRRVVGAVLALALAAGLVVGLGMGNASAAALTPQQAIDSGAASAAAQGVRTSASVLDRTTGKLLASRDGDTPVVSASIVKLFTAAYYITKYGAGSSQAAAMSQMVIYSDDNIESNYWNCALVDWARSRYGLSGHTANSAYSCAGWWGTVQITANDMTRFLFNVSHDTAVWPTLSFAMLASADNGADGFDQNFGFNAQAGAGSKQGWTDIVVSPYNYSVLGLHSVGFTSKYFAAVLQTGTDYGTMRATATRTAALISGSVVPAPVVAVPPKPKPKPPPYPRLTEAAATRFVGNLYHTLLGRTDVPPSLVRALQRGTIGKAVIATSVSLAGSRQVSIVQHLFTACLKRTPNAAGVAKYLNALTHGANYDTFAGVICGSTESVIKAKYSQATWIQTNYQTFLGRAAGAADITSWTVQIKKVGYVAVSRSIIGSPEAGRHLLNGVYQTMLGRGVDPSGMRVSGQMRLHGLLTVPVAISQSAEFVNRKR